MKEPIKKCRNCGWEYSWRHPGNYCGICHKPLLKAICPTCGTYVPESDRMPNGRAYCKKCYAEYCRNKIKRMLKRHDDAYLDWLKAISEIPKPYKTLTEDQWLNACKHFGGCAFCGDSDISARSFFIPFKDGGRYCDWNIVPLCQRCATATRTAHPWRYFTGNKATRENIVGYLRPILEERINEARET